eukprot:14659193-Ditylum_brightwellii.AAC.1
MDDKFNVDKSLIAAEQKFCCNSAEEFQKATCKAKCLRRRKQVGVGDDILEEEEEGEEGVHHPLRRRFQRRKRLTSKKGLIC